MFAAMMACCALPALMCQTRLAVQSCWRVWVFSGVKMFSGFLPDKHSDFAVQMTFDFSASL
jgi:hypothetical protein